MKFAPSPKTIAICYGNVKPRESFTFAGKTWIKLDQTRSMSQDGECREFQRTNAVEQQK